jgi:hypothetical protein
MEMKPIYLLVGAPGSGKTWVGRQMAHKFHHVENDAFIGQPYENYLNAVAAASRAGKKPVLAETPQSISRIAEPLSRLGFDVRLVFILETPDVTRSRYEAREGKPIPKQHLGLIQTYMKRAMTPGAVSGTSAQILNYLKTV